VRRRIEQNDSIQIHRHRYVYRKPARVATLSLALRARPMPWHALASAGLWWRRARMTVR
jgi:hypothetical protein